MPNRIIREGWLESEPINTLDPQAERFFLRLCLRADDFGRYHANPVLLKSNLFPLREDVRSTDIPRWLAACESAGLLRCYEADAKPFLEIPKFGQRTRAEFSKFPPPPSFDGHPSVISHTLDGHPRTEKETETRFEFDKGSPPSVGQPSAVCLPFESQEFTEAWGDWLKYRKERKLKQYVPTGMKTQFARLKAMGEKEAIEAIRHSIAQNYQGIFEPSGGSGTRSGRRHTMAQP